MQDSDSLDFAELPYTQQVEIDDICDRFECELKAGKEPDVQKFLRWTSAGSRLPLLLELMAAEHHHRGGDLREIQAEYVERFPELRLTMGIVTTPHPPEVELGSQLGDFRIQGKIGSGGMGVVYEALDLRLERSVALKVLPGVFADDAERLQRFEREAKILASLNHPNIATLHGIEVHDGILFFVLELVPGKTLAEMIRARPLPIEDVKAVFGQMAAALEAAHAQGIIHRDLKPDNVKVTPDGTVKVLDFGLATSQLEVTGQEIGSSPDLSDTPPAVSAIAGTIPYMSPEQARGRPVDKRTDVWAFGCCLYEALAGRRAFADKTAAEVMAAIADGQPDWEALPANTPPSIRYALHRCLAKDPGRRLRDLGDVWIDDAYLDGLVNSSGNRSKKGGLVIGRWLALSVALAAVVAILMIWNSQGRTRPPAQSVSRVDVNLPATTSIAVAGPTAPGNGQPTLALTPDGRKLVYVADIEGVAKLCVRRLGQFEATVLEGTEGAFCPFISPNGRWVGFFADYKLKKVLIEGGQPVTLCDVGHCKGASWSDDGHIYFTDRFGRDLTRIHSQRGEKQELASSRWINGYLWPDVLPEGKGILLGREGHGIVYVSPDGEEELIHPQGMHARYVDSGHILYALPGRLWAIPFDLDQMKVTGSPRPVVDGVRTEGRDAAHFAVARNGTMVYVEGPSARPAALVQRSIEQTEKETRLPFSVEVYGSFQVSPDGRRIAVEVWGTTNSDIWIYDLGRPNRTRLTIKGNNRFPIWTPDGGSIVFSSDRDGQLNLYRKAVGEDADIERLAKSEHVQYAYDWSADGEWLVYYQATEDASSDLWRLSPKTGETLPLVTSPDEEGATMFSPDGEWIAYSAFHPLGGNQVFVRPFPGPGRRQPVCTESGHEPVWSPEGDEIYYRNGRNWMSVSVNSNSGRTLTLGAPRLLFSGNYRDVQSRSYDITPDGKHLLLLRGDEDPAPTQVHVVLNWFDELVRLARPGSE